MEATRNGSGAGERCDSLAPCVRSHRQAPCGSVASRGPRPPPPGSSLTRRRRCTRSRGRHRSCCGSGRDAAASGGTRAPSPADPDETRGYDSLSPPLSRGSSSRARTPSIARRPGPGARLSRASWSHERLESDRDAVPAARPPLSARAPEPVLAHAQAPEWKTPPEKWASVLSSGTKAPTERAGHLPWREAPGREPLGSGRARRGARAGLRATPHHLEDSRRHRLPDGGDASEGAHAAVAPPTRGDTSTRRDRGQGSPLTFSIWFLRRFSSVRVLRLLTFSTVLLVQGVAAGMGNGGGREEEGRFLVGQPSPEKLTSTSVLLARRGCGSFEGYSPRLTRRSRGEVDENDTVGAKTTATAHRPGALPAVTSG